MADSAAGTISGKHLAEYIAASAPVHCVDGWAYLGKAIGSHLAGDPGVARHLAYYAELRASMSLLASGGVGIFNNRHYVVDGVNQVVVIPAPTGAGTGRRGTHDAAWAYLQGWSPLADAVGLLGASITPGGIAISEWVNQVPGGASWPALGAELLKSFGLDLRRFATDREARNNSSYRPTEFRDVGHVPSVEACTFVEHLWGLLEPTGSPGFEHLDLRLLAVTLQRAFRGLHGVEPGDAPAVYEAMVQSVVDDVLTDPGQRAVYRTQLLQLAQSPDELVTHALSRSGVANPRHHMHAMARAVFLLRIAAGGARHTMRQAALPLGDLEFWWRGLGERRGLWDTGPQVEDLVDRWADVAVALEDLEDWRSTGDTSISSLREAASRSLLTVSALEIVPMWALAS